MKVTIHYEARVFDRRTITPGTPLCAMAASNIGNVTRKWQNVTCKRCIKRGLAWFNKLDDCYAHHGFLNGK